MRQFLLSQLLFRYINGLASIAVFYLAGIFIALLIIVMGDNDKQFGDFYFQWHINNICNLRCIHCYQKDYGAKGFSSSDLLSIAKIIEKTLHSWRRIGRISLTGGEPFLNPDALFLLLDFFNSSNAFQWTGILTNGTLITEEISYRLSQYKKLKEVQISLDGSSSNIHDNIRGQGSFDRTIKGIETLKQNKIPVTFMSTLTRMNKCDVLNLIDFAIKIGAAAITIERIVPTGRLKDNDLSIPADDLKEVYSEIYKKKVEVEKKYTTRIRTSRPLWCLCNNTIGGFCPVGLSSLAILHDGTVLPCRRLEINLGNIITDGIFKIWYTSKVLWEIRNKRNLDKDCQTCDYLDNCGGCRAIAYAVTGNYMAKDPQCWK